MTVVDDRLFTEAVRLPVGRALSGVNLDEPVPSWCTTTFCPSRPRGGLCRDGGV
jgi:hypothetical protein